MADENFIPRKSYPNISPSFIRNKLITNGLDEKIVGPITDTFSSIFAKFAVDERLNYDVIERALRGLGGSVSARFATLVVAASDSSPNGIIGADYKCDGTSDNVTIQLAIDEMEAYGTPYGCIYFLEGEYDIDAALVVTSSYIKFQGMGPGTVFKQATNGTHYFFDLQGGPTIIDGIRFINNEKGIKLTEVPATIQNCYFDSIDQALHWPNETGVSGPFVILNNEFNGCGSSGAGKYAIDRIDATCGVANTRIIGNLFYFSNGNCLRWIGDSGTESSRQIIANNDFDLSVLLDTLERVTITGNTFSTDLSIEDIDIIAIAGNTLLGTYTEVGGITNISKAGNVGIT